MSKAKYLFTLGNNYYNEKTFEYRGHTYTVEYSSGYTTFTKKPAYIQHREAQENIDRLIANGNLENEIKKAGFDDSFLNLYYEY